MQISAYKLTDLIPQGRINPKCQHPDRFHLPATDRAQATEIEVSVLVASFFAGQRPTHILETGTHAGDTTQILCNYNAHATIHSIESNREWHDTLRNALGDHWPNLNLIHGDALKWTPGYGIKFGAAFFDATVEHRAEEYRHFRPHLEPNALVAFHDTSTYHPTGHHVRELVKLGLIEGINIETPRGVFIGRHLG